MARRSSDESLIVKFESRAVENRAKSYGEVILDNENKKVGEIVAAKRPIHDNIDYVRIQGPGDRDFDVHRPATFCIADQTKIETVAQIDLRQAVFNDPDAWRSNCRYPEAKRNDCDVHRFPDEWARYKAGQVDQQHGTSLKEWAAIDRASVEDLAFYKVYTVEQLAGLNDSNAQRFFALRQRARDFLESAKGSPDPALRAELDEKTRQLAAMQDQINQLLASQSKGEKLTPKSPEKTR